MLTFRIWQDLNTPISINVILHNVILHKETDPKKWLLELAEGEIVRDGEGRRIRLGKEQLYFDIDGEFGPILPLPYYGFTADQLRTAIKETLAPEPKVEWPEWVPEGARLENELRFNEWQLVVNGGVAALPNFNNFVNPPLLTDHLDKTKVYVKGEE